MIDKGKRIGTIPDVATYLKVKTSKVRSMIFQGTIPGVIRIGRLIRFDMDQIDTWIAEGSTTGAFRERKDTTQ